MATGAFGAVGNLADTVTMGEIRLQAGTDRTLFVDWTFTEKRKDGKKTVNVLDHYDVTWQYTTKQGVWFAGATNSVNLKNDTYNAPSNAVKVRVWVVPVAKTHKQKVNKKEKDVAYFTGQKSKVKSYKFTASTKPANLSNPSFTVEGFKLTAKLDNITDNNTDYVQFQITNKDKKKAYVTKMVKVNARGHVAFSCTGQSGQEYKIRARGVNVVGKETVIDVTPSTTPTFRMKEVEVYEYGDWTEYSPEPEGLKTVPNTPVISEVKLLSTNEVQIICDTGISNSASSYEFQWTLQKRWFDSNPDSVQSQEVDKKHAEILFDDESDHGKIWYFRVRCKNDTGNSSWCSIFSVLLAEKPNPPTTWSETPTAISGRDINLYWQHNSADTSAQTSAQVEITVNGSTTVQTITGETSYYQFRPTATFTWRVRTKGAHPDYSNWSSVRTVTVYAPPTLSLAITNLDPTATEPNSVTSFPISIEAVAGPSPQTAVTLSLSIISLEQYTTYDSVGRQTIVSAGQELYSRVFNLSSNTFNIDLSASDVDLQNGIRYRLIGHVSMNSGLTADQVVPFNVEWDEGAFYPDAEILFDDDDLSATIRPYCLEDWDEEDEDAAPGLVDGVTLAVYRREYDGTFTEIQTGLDNTKDITVTDPHPALDYARYRIVATMISTGAIAFADIPDLPVEEPSIVIQWDDVWDAYDVDEYEFGDSEDMPVDAPLNTNMLKLPYNIKVSPKYDKDSELVEYIGREHPVSYYGTQKGESASWSTVIPATDTETLYQLRRLAIYMGDVYVREPSGTGYWAHIGVTFNQSYDDLTIPITFEITRVEGGI